MRCRWCGAPWLKEYAPCEHCGLSYQGQIADPDGSNPDAGKPLRAGKTPPRPAPTSRPSSGTKVLS